MLAQQTLLHDVVNTSETNRGWAGSDVAATDALLSLSKGAIALCATLTAPAQHALLHRVDERALLGAGAQVFLLEAVIPLGLGVGVVDEQQRRLVLQALLLAHHDVAILAQEGPDIGPEQRLQRLHPGR